MLQKFKGLLFFCRVPKNHPGGGGGILDYDQ